MPRMGVRNMFRSAQAACGSRPRHRPHRMQLPQRLHADRAVVVTRLALIRRSPLVRLVEKSEAHE
jgi:hypothetical protein